MYLDAFNLKAYPFQLIPDSDFLYLSAAHARAKAYLDYAIWSPDGFVVLTGEVGSGKTILLKKLLSELADSVIIAKVFQTQLDELEFLQALLLEFGYQAFDAKKVELLNALKSCLLEQHENKRQVVLIVDEAQHLSARVLEEIRLLSDLESQNEKILNVILVGQPALNRTLDAPGMEQLTQRIRLRFHIKALGRSEIENYINHRLAIAGAENRALFPSETMSWIYRYTDGIPRLINVLCDTTLTAAFAENISQISVDLVKTAIEELQWVPYAERVRDSKGPKSAAAALNNGDTKDDADGLLPSPGAQEKLNRLYAFVPKFSASVVQKIKSMDKQLKEITTLLKEQK